MMMRVKSKYVSLITLSSLFLANLSYIANVLLEIALKKAIFQGKTVYRRAQRRFFKRGGLVPYTMQTEPNSMIILALSMTEMQAYIFCTC